MHSDTLKSHTVDATFLGKALLVWGSTKQKITAKSSTEGELIGTSDKTGKGLHLREFIIDQGYKVNPLIIMQDNMSTMAIIKRGEPTSDRSRHINIRYFWLKEMVSQNKCKVVHCPTEKMWANLLTKPLNGAQFVKERFVLTNW